MERYEVAIAHVYRLEADFWAGYVRRGWHDELRAKYHPLSFPTVHDKVHVRRDELDASTTARQGAQDRFGWLREYCSIDGIWRPLISYAS